MRNFDLNKYLGTWFEIARIKNNFEPLMTDVKAEYSLNRDGSIKVINSGYINGKLNQISGIAEPTDKPGVLKLSFFPGQETEYRILFVNENYSYALVGGERDNLLWILSREKTLDEDVLAELISIGLQSGYDMGHNIVNLIFTERNEGF